MRSFLAVGAALALAVIVTGCSESDLPLAVEGEQGALQFSYKMERLDHPLLTKAEVFVDVFDADPEAKLTARAKGAGAEVQSFSPTFRCTGTNLREVQPEEECTEDEERSVMWTAGVVAAEPGEFKLEIVDGSGEVVDWLTLESALAARAEFSLDQEEIDPSKGATMVVGQAKTLFTRAFDSKGRFLETGFGVSWTFEDPSIVNANENPSGGGPSTILVEAKKAGSSTVIVYTGNLQQAVPIEVTGG